MDDDGTGTGVVAECGELDNELEVTERVCDQAGYPAAMLLLLALACAPSEDTDFVKPIDTGSVDDTAEPATTDADVVRALIDGEGDLGATLATVALSGGFPVATDAGTFLFVAEGGPWSLAGDHNGWALDAMTVADEFSWIEVGIEAPAGKVYKLVDREGTHQADPWARSYGFDDFGERSYVEPPAGFHVDRWPGVGSATLRPRTVRVLVPPGAGPFPLVLAQDGQNLVNPAAPWGGWRLDGPVAELGVLVVGIDNTDDRVDEYTHVPDRISGDTLGGTADAYAALVHDVVEPLVASRYQVDDRRALLGSSLGGLVSLYVADVYPGEYDLVASLSGTLGWGRLGLDNVMMQDLWTEPTGTVVYVDSGGGPGDGGCEDPNGDGYVADDPDATDNYCTTWEFADALAARGFAWEGDLHHWWEPGGLHNEAAWAARVGRPLALLVE